MEGYIFFVGLSKAISDASLLSCQDEGHSHIVSLAFVKKDLLPRHPSFPARVEALTALVMGSEEIFEKYS